MFPFRISRESPREFPRRKRAGPLLRPTGKNPDYVREAVTEFPVWGEQGMGSDGLPESENGGPHFLCHRVWCAPRESFWAMRASSPSYIACVCRRGVLPLPEQRACGPSLPPSPSPLPLPRRPIALRGLPTSVRWIRLRAHRGRKREEEHLHCATRRNRADPAALDPSGRESPVYRAIAPRCPRHVGLFQCAFERVAALRKPFRALDLNVLNFN